MRKSLRDTREQGGVVLIHGEAGIGKTRLLEECLGDPALQDMTILRGAVYEFERDHAFGVFTETLGLLPNATDPRRARLGRLLISETGSAPEVFGGDLGFRIVEGILEFLEELAVDAPTVLALEDLHWADPATLRTLSAICRRLAEFPLTVVATARPSPVRDHLVRMVETLASGRAIPVHLTALEDAAVAALVERLIDAKPGSQLMTEVAGAAGNPLYVTELVEAMRREGAIELVQGRAETHWSGIPATLRMTLLRRLDALPAPTVDLLRVCAVLGTPFTMTDLCAVTHRSAVDLLPLIEEAISQLILQEAGDQLVFRHELIWAAIYQDLPLALSRQLHREAAEALAQTSTPKTRVAHHLVRGAEVGDTEAIAWLRRAGVAVAPQSAAIAVSLLGQAAQLAAGTPEEQDAIQAERAPLLGLSGQIDDAEEISRDLLTRGVPPEVEVRLRVGLAHVLARRGRFRAARKQIDRAAARVPEPVRTLVRAPGTYISLMLGEVGRAVNEARRVVAVAEETDHPVALSTALGTLTLAAGATGDTDDGLRAGRASVTAADRANAMFSGFLFPEVNVAAVLTSSGDAEGCASVLLQGMNRVERAGSPSLLPYYHAANAVHRLHVGDWDDARAEAEASLAVGEEVGTHWVHTPAAVLVRILVSRNDISGATQVLATIEGDLETRDPILGDSFILWVQALIEEAQRISPEDVLVSATRAWDVLPQLRFSFGMWPMAVDVTRLALAAGARDLAERVVTELEDFSARIGVPAAIGAALRARGLITGETKTLVDAATAYARSERPVEHAWAEEDAAAALAADGRTVEARARFDRALVTYERVDATRDAARLVATMRWAGIRRGARGRRSRPDSGWAALTPTEHQVARLVAEGMTNAAVADRLFITRYTVETHMKHIFTKLNLASRAELAAEVVRHTAKSD